jgi:hypothetical protein
MPRLESSALRGAVAGAAAAALWSLQQPLDVRVFGVRYSDTELLGTAVTRGPAWRPIGFLLHLANGAAFGAAYGLVAPRVPGPGAAKGLAAGMAEHLATWPLTGPLLRVHPARRRLPQLWGNHAAFAQAAWRHALFGAALGELNRRLAPPG